MPTKQRQFLGYSVDAWRTATIELGKEFGVLPANYKPTRTQREPKKPGRKSKPLWPTRRMTQGVAKVGTAVSEQPDSNDSCTIAETATAAHGSNPWMRFPKRTPQKPPTPQTPEEQRDAELDKRQKSIIGETVAQTFVLGGRAGLSLRYSCLSQRGFYVRVGWIERKAPGRPARTSSSLA